MQKFFKRNNLRFHYLDFPADYQRRPALIFLPGLTANASFVTGAITAGLNEHVRVLSLDFRGRGLSDKPDSGYTMADYVDDVLGLMPDPYGPAGGPPILPDEMAAETAALIKNCTYQTSTGNHITMQFGQHAQNTVEIIATWLESTGERS